MSGSPAEAGNRSTEQLERAARAAADWEQTKWIDLVCEGGGVLGIGLVGAYAVLEARGYRVQNLAGTSAGAIVATLIAAGYTAAEVRDIIFDLDFSRITDPHPEARLALIGGRWLGWGASVLRHQGIYRGDFFLELMREKLAAKGVTTFRQLRYEDGKSPDPRYRHKVQVIVSDVTNRRLLRLPMDAKAVLGVEPDDLSVAEAVRMSMSIPFFFSPVRWKHPDGKQQLTLVDGGMLSNFPVWLFDTPELPDWPTFGLRLVSPEARDGGGLSLPVPLPPNTGRLLSYALTLVQTMLAAHDRLYLDSETYARTIGVPTGSASGTDFALSEATKRQLYEAGRAATTEFLDQQWSFAEYIATFRSGPRPGRRDILKDAMARIAAGAPLPTPVSAGG